jgi:hypothetical protein
MKMIFPFWKGLGLDLFKLKRLFHFESFADRAFRAKTPFFKRVGILFAQGRHLWIISTLKK